MTTTSTGRLRTRKPQASIFPTIMDILDAVKHDDGSGQQGIDKAPATQSDGSGQQGIDKAPATQSDGSGTAQ
ncbi:MAG: hypothetical protein AAB948_02210 [Patescibacteria group bacterium]